MRYARLSRWRAVFTLLIITVLALALSAANSMLAIVSCFALLPWDYPPIIALDRTRLKAFFLKPVPATTYGVTVNTPTIALL